MEEESFLGLCCGSASVRVQVSFTDLSAVRPSALKHLELHEATNQLFNADVFPAFQTR